MEWKKGEYVRLVANKDYWRGAPKVDEVIYQTYQNQDTMAQDLKTGAIQTGWNIPSAQFDALNNEPDLESIRAVTIGFDQLGFNCADQKKFPKSTGHPVLQDPAFRSALQWAIDKEKIVSIGYNGNAVPADTIVTRDFYSAEADFHWTPPAEQAYTFDLDKARQALDEAGYADGDGDGIREYKGKPIKLRLYARTESPESQNCGKLITGWFEEIGLDIDYEVIDDGALGDKQYNYEGDQFAPDFDLFIWGWGGDVDPNFILSVLTTGSIENWSDCNLSNEEYDRLFLEQQTTIDVQKRIDIVHRMQEIVYDESPYIPLVYPLDLLAANKGKWTGWVRANENRGSWWYNTQPDTYVAVHPGAVAPAESGGGSSTGVIIGSVIAAIFVIVIVVILLRRRGRTLRDRDVTSVPTARPAGVREARGRRMPAPRSFSGGEAEVRPPALVDVVHVEQHEGRRPRRPRRPHEVQPGQVKRPVALLAVARRARGDEVVPRVGAALGARHDVVDGEVPGAAAVLAAVPVAGEDRAPRDACGGGAARDVDVGVEADDERDLVGAALAAQRGAGLLEHLGLVLEQQHDSSPHRTDVERLVGGVQDQHLAHRFR